MALHQDGSSNGHSTDPLEKDHYGHGNLNNNNLTMGANDSSGDALERVRTAGSISIPPELFEKLYLSPENRVKGDLRKTFGNPTPLYVLPAAYELPCHPQINVPDHHFHRLGPSLAFSSVLHRFLAT